MCLGLERGKALARGLVHLGSACRALELTGALNFLWDHSHGERLLQGRAASQTIVGVSLVKRSCGREEWRIWTGKLETSFSPRCLTHLLRCVG